MKLSFILPVTAWTFATMLSVADLHAVPAYPGIHTHVNPDGTSVDYMLYGDEYYHAFYSLDGYPLVQVQDGSMQYARFDGERLLPSGVTATDAVRRKSGGPEFLQEAVPEFSELYDKAVRRASIQRSALTDFPTVGNLKGIVLVVEFADNTLASGHTIDLFDRMMNAEGFSDYGATGSVRDYFRDQSSGQFNPSFDVFGPVKLSRELSYYGQNASSGLEFNAVEMITEACKKADEEYDIDFSKYDNDGDGAVDFVYVIYAGYGESYGAPAWTVWPHSANVSDFYQSLTLDGTDIGLYACSCELKYTTGTTLEGIGTFCHEFSHILGLPDLYQTNGGNVTQLGSWDLMESGSYNNESRTPPSYSAFERYSVGWLDFTDIGTPMTGVSLPALSSSNIAYRLTTDYDNEYFVLENRQLSGWDRFLPGSGLMITHIDYHEGYWNTNGVNNDPTHPRVDLVEADNTQGSSPEGDLFPGSSGNTAFTDFTLPSSHCWDGSPIGKAVTGIREHEDGLVTFNFMQGKLAVPVLGQETEVTDTSFVAHWSAVDGAVGYSLSVRALLPAEKRPLPVGEDFELMHEGDYPDADSEDVSDSLDSLMTDEGWTGAAVFQAGGMCQLGDYGIVGELTTPHLFLSPEDGRFTVGFYARSYPGRTMNFDVIARDSNDEVVDEVKMKATSEGTYFLLEMDGGTDATKITVRTRQERLFVDDFRVVRGHGIDSATVWEIENPHYAFDEITDNHFKVTGLSPQTAYEYAVRARSVDALNDSEESDPHVVTLSASSGISRMNCDDISVAVDGRTLAVTVDGTAADVSVWTASGVCVYRQSVSGRFEVTLPGPGVYIVRVGTYVAKVAVG